MIYSRNIQQSVIGCQWSVVSRRGYLASEARGRDARIEWFYDLLDTFRLKNLRFREHDFQFIKKPEITKTQVKPNTFSHHERLGVGFRYVYLHEPVIETRNLLYN